MTNEEDSSAQYTATEGATPAPTSTPAQEESNPLQFSGKGSEYFGIWIVNLLLSLITLGIYSAWAKVRRMQYFYRHTTLAGASFNYLGNPKQILKGRIIAFVFVAAYYAVHHFSPLLGTLLALIYLPVLPIILLKSLRFRLYNASYRGLRFRFLGTQKEAYKVFLLWPLITPLTAYLLVPFSHQRIKAYQHNNAAYGQSPFSFHAPVRAFYTLYLKTALLFGSCTIALAGLVFWLLYSIREALFLALAYMEYTQTINIMAILIPLAVVVAVLLLSWLVRPYFEARMKNLVWNNTRLGTHRFVSTLSARKLFFIQITNLLGTVLTLGLFRPFAVIRITKYRLETVQLVSSESVENFVAGQQEALGAMGEEAIEFFDIDLAL